MRDYKDEVQLLAENAVDELDKYEYEDIYDMVMDCMQSTNFVGSTQKGLEILQDTNKEPEMWRSIVTLAKEDWRGMIQAIAFDVMEQDVREAIENELKKQG